MTMTLSASRVLQPVKQLVNGAARKLRMIAYSGVGRICPVCEKPSRRFRDYGFIPRNEAQCTRCGALERHRLLWIFLKRKTDLFDGRPKNMLHVAPEACFEPRFKQQLGDGYLTADLFNPRAMVKMDITDIAYPDQSFDVIYCSHVLEHVPDDKKALSEFHRVLKSDGWAIILVPITAEVTYEDPSITTPEGRLEHFGQEDHVRVYGPDYIDRLRDAGFSVEMFSSDDLVNNDEITAMGLTDACGQIFFCSRQEY